MIESIIEKLKLVPLTGEGGMYRYLYAGEKDAAEGSLTAPSTIF